MGNSVYDCSRLTSQAEMPEHEVLRRTRLSDRHDTIGPEMRCCAHARVNQGLLPLWLVACCLGLSGWTASAQASVDVMSAKVRTTCPATTAEVSAPHWTVEWDRTVRFATTHSSNIPDEGASAEPGSEVAGLDDDIRFLPTTRPQQPQPQHPPPSTPENVDTGKPFSEWQRLTDDWFGWRPKLDDRGITVQASLAIDIGKAFRGGTDTAGVGSSYLFNLNVTVDTQRLLAWKGGTVFINFRNQDGKHHSLDGAFQTTSHIETPERTEISEFWYEQVLFDGRLRLKAGKIDANTEFAFVSNGAEFLNDSMSYSPTIRDFPTDPDPATGIVTFVYPNEHLYAGLGVLDGAGHEGVNTGTQGPATFFGAPSDLFMIGEAGLKWSAEGRRDGRLGLGAWHHTGSFSRFDGGHDSGTSGVYLVLDQILWREHPEEKDDQRGVAMYFQYGHADSAVSTIVNHVGGGLIWTGAIPTRAGDVTGMGLSWAGLSDARNADLHQHDELVVEGFYKIRLNGWLSLKPDLQFIHNARDRDTVVGTIQLVADF
jgi:carbohydrate-selective porin OprB